MASEEKKLEIAKQLKGKSPTPYYIMNIIPGLGTALYGRPVMGGILLVATVCMAALVFFGASAFMMGLAITVLSVVGILFTAGLSLLMLPIGILLLFLGAVGPFLGFIILLALFAIAQYVVHKMHQRTLQV